MVANPQFDPKALVTMSSGTVSAVQASLIKADLCGAEVEVVRAANPSLVGKRGLVVKETEHTLVLVTAPKNEEGGIKRGREVGNDKHGSQEECGFCDQSSTSNTSVSGWRIGSFEVRVARESYDAYPAIESYEEVQGSTDDRFLSTHQHFFVMYFYPHHSQHCTITSASASVIQAQRQHYEQKVKGESVLKIQNSIPLGWRAERSLMYFKSKQRNKVSD